MRQLTVLAVLKLPSDGMASSVQAVGGRVVHMLTAGVLCQAKNAALKEAGAVVPDSFEAFEGAIKATYDKLVAEGTLVPQPDVPPPSVPMDLEAAKKAGKVTAVPLAGDMHRAKGAASDNNVFVPRLHLFM